MSNLILNKREQVAIDITLHAGKIIMSNFDNLRSVSYKKDRELVSNVDIETEEEIIKLIKRYFPNDSILCEEKKELDVNPDSNFRWIIDALDGTHNYVRNIKIFGISIALEFHKEVISGMIYLPTEGEFYLAKKGQGAYLNGKRIKVSNRSLKEATVVYDSRIVQDKEFILACLTELIDHVFNIRMFGSTVRSLTYLAEGKLDAEIEFKDNVWDFAAGLLLLEEAGGVATDFQGRRWTTDTTEFIASNGVFHDELIKIISKVKKEHELKLNYSGVRSTSHNFIPDAKIK